MGEKQDLQRYLRDEVDVAREIMSQASSSSSSTMSIRFGNKTYLANGQKNGRTMYSCDPHRLGIQYVDELGCGGKPALSKVLQGSDWKGWAFGHTDAAGNLEEIISISGSNEMFPPKGLQWVCYHRHPLVLERHKEAGEVDEYA